jgi:histidine triad (HIT) family protein
VTPDCIFCQIATKHRPAALLYEDEHCVAFRDIAPKAPTHLLIVPKRHIERVSELTEADQPLLGHLLLTLTAMARREGLAENGYRAVINCGPDGGQTVPHLHLHLFGGRAMHWPPG